MTNHEYVVTVIRAFQDSDCDGDLYGRVDENGDVYFLVGVNDVFWWATADCERIRPDDLPLLAECVKDLAPTDDPFFLPELFAARKRRMRPQHPFARTYDKERRGYFEDQLDPSARALFDAAGPVRDRKDEG